MILQEFLIKLAMFFFIGFIFGLLEFFFLSTTENVPFQKGRLNIGYYFPLSFGIFLPIFSFFLSSIYYPIGMVRFSSTHINFEISHLSGKVFAFCGIILIFIFSFYSLTFLNIPLSEGIVIYFYWFFQVLLTFILFNFLPFYPSILGIALLREYKKYLVRNNKIENLWHIHILSKIEIFIFMFFVISLNYFTLDAKIKSIFYFLTYKSGFMAYLFLTIFLFSTMIVLLYVKKKKYQQYINYVKDILRDSFLHESSSHHPSKK